MKKNPTNYRNIMIAVDESENAARAVEYVRDLLNGISGFHIAIITIIPEPSEDYFPSGNEKNEWKEKKKAQAEQLLAKYSKTLGEAKFEEKDITTYVVMTECGSIGTCILEEQKKRSCGTLVIGRRGISKKEEFIFGSTSNKILHSAEDCSVWVIE